MNDTTRLLTVSQIAESHGKTRQNVLHMIKTRALPARRAGRLWMVDPSDAIALWGDPINKPKARYRTGRAAERRAVLGGDVIIVSDKRAMQRARARQEWLASQGR
jgi:hypothetical protein